MKTVYYQKYTFKFTDEFHEFLNLYNLLDIVIFRMSDHMDTLTSEQFEYFKRQIHNHPYGCFVFNKTLEGGEYWYKLSDKFDKYREIKRAYGV